MDGTIMNNNNFWGEPDDVDFPDWMLPDNHPRKQKVARTKSTMTFEEAIAQAMAKPSVPMSDALLEDMKDKFTNEPD